MGVLDRAFTPHLWYTFDLGHLRPGRTRRPVPPSGGPRERCPFFLPTIDVLLRLCTQKHRTGWFQFLRTRLRHRVRCALGTTASLHIVTTLDYAIGE